VHNYAEYKYLIDIFMIHCESNSHQMKNSFCKTKHVLP
jgi:hypothetical protein